MLVEGSHLGCRLGLIDLAGDLDKSLITFRLHTGRSSVIVGGGNRRAACVLFAPGHSSRSQKRARLGDTITIGRLSHMYAK